MIATLWLDHGVLLRNDFAVPNPPPRTWKVMLLPPPDRAWLDGEAVPTSVEIHEVEFQLQNHSASGEVAHYMLNSAPPEGFRWLAVNGNLRAERVR